MPAMLFLHGGDEHARRVFSRDGHGEWSQALPVVLEKHGYLDLEVAGVDELPRLDLDAYPVVLVGRLPAEAWDDPLLDLVKRRTRPIVIEGPAPRRVLDLVGARTVARLATPGRIRASNTPLSIAARKHGSPPEAQFGPPLVRQVPHSGELDWRKLPVPITEDQAEAWNAAGWEVEQIAVDTAATVLAEWVAVDGSKSPAIVQLGETVVTAMSLFAALGQAHTAPPWEAGEFRNSSPSLGAEALLLGLLDLLHAGAGENRVRVLPWPRGASWVLNVRHDFDRPLTAAQVQQVVSAHDDAGTAATWYWRARHLRPPRGLVERAFRHSGNDALRTVAASARQEVAFHSERLFAGAEQERRLVERVLGHPVAGVSAHGDPTCFRFQGAPNVLWAEEQGLAYTELIQQAHWLPHRFASLEPDGRIRALNVLCLPHHLSLDISTSKPETHAEAILAAAPRWAALRGFLQVMNHPDINQSALFALLSSLPVEGRLDWTAATACDWWNATHRLDRVRIRNDADGRPFVDGAAPKSVALEIVRPDGSSSVVSGSGRRAP